MGAGCSRPIAKLPQTRRCCSRAQEERMAESNRRPVCAVIGVGPGLGAALARRFAAEYAVALVARGEDKLASLAKEIENAGGKALAVSADVSKAADITSAFEKIRRQLGEVDALLYNA